jgi:SAM-dependent methyltransferase
MTTKKAMPSYGASTHYDAAYLAWQHANIDIKTKIKVKRFAPFIKPTDTVIDFGSAAGWMIAALPGARKIGVELNDVAREKSMQEHGIEAYKNLADVPDRIADVVVSNHTLEHIAGPYDALQQITHKLKPGGLLVLVLPIDDWRAQRRYDPTDINRHLYTWTPLNLGNLLDEAGYNVECMRIIHRTLMRGLDKFYRLPGPMFEAVSWFYSHVRHRQELLATAHLKLASSTKTGA